MGPRSNFWNHSELFQITGFGVIDPNRPFLEKMFLYYIWAKSLFVNAAIWILKEILISSLQHLKEKKILKEYHPMKVLNYIVQPTGIPHFYSYILPYRLQNCQNLQHNKDKKRYWCLVCAIWKTRAFYWKILHIKFSQLYYAPYR